MFLPILALLVSFVAATVFGLLGAYFAGTTGAVVALGASILLSFLLIARWAGR